MLSENCISALDTVNQWMETNYPPSILPFNRPQLINTEANCLVCKAHWPLTSPPCHNNSAELASLSQELSTLQKRRKNPLCATDRTILKETVSRLAKQQDTDAHHRRQKEVEDHRKRKFSDITTYEEAVENHEDYESRFVKIAAELAQAKIDAEAALAHRMRLKKLIYGIDTTSRGEELYRIV